MTDKNSLLILIPFISLMSLGLVMVTSSSIYVADDLTGNPFYFASRQMLFISIGLISMSIFLLIPSDILYKLDWIFMLISIVLLIALFIPDIGTSVNGSIRWIRAGPINIQPSELCKFSLILYISGYSVRRMSEIDSLRSFLKPLFLLFIISILIMSQPDLGSTAIICLLVVSILFYAGISFFQFSLLSILIALLGYMAISTSPMRLARVLAFTDPFAEDVVRNAGWQLSNSLISIGQGGWFGLGVGNSFQKNFFLPEAHTDFIFAILVEELGIIGGLLLISLFVILFIGILKVALDSFGKERLFQGYVSFGILILIAIQSLFNIAVNIGLLPTKGLTLPFISYGGTSIIIMMSLIAIVLRINKENKLI
ncbi:putative lipid II flippase FtsW [Gammaproteobacteria bacterium]|nr:putative lipid II flippase FtsW [Gammaproteobacteria bacterium]MDB4849238.1 putative lipid II flippase FtsW [Gammaproteobacteria bacterium]MDC0401798.1 putative lipid II flippase FtsW [Gammaproteobacteria bacterium]MDC1074018.1 putative lipid II flippase FtsW [Gammaproteobacteria bacterium]